MCTAKSVGKRILKIGRHLLKLWLSIECPVSFDSRGIIAFSVAKCVVVVVSCVR